MSWKKTKDNTPPEDILQHFNDNRYNEKKKRPHMSIPADQTTNVARKSRLSELSRRSSTFETRSGGLKLDPRPLNNREYHLHCCQVLSAFLIDRGYTHTVNINSLLKPTSKEFNEIIKFLFHQVDPLYEVKPEIKIDDEVLTMFRKLGYPFLIPKSSLYAIGSSTTWPCLLSALYWLVQLLDYIHHSNQSHAANTEKKDENELFLQYYTKAYAHFLSGEDEMCEQLDKELEYTLRAREENINKELVRLEAEHTALKKEIEKGRNSPSAFINLEKKKASIIIDINSITAHVYRTQKHLKEMQMKTEDCYIDLINCEAEVHVAQQNVNLLKKKIANQSVTREDVLEIIQRRQQLDELLQSVVHQYGTSKVHYDKSEKDFAIAYEALEKVGKKYNNLSEKLQLIPIQAKRAKGMDYEFRLNRFAHNPGDMCVIDIKGSVTHRLHQLKDNYVLKTQEYQTHRILFDEMLTNIDCKIHESREKNKLASREIQQLEKSFNRLRDARMTILRNLAWQAERMKTEVNASRKFENRSSFVSEENSIFAQNNLKNMSRKTKKDQESLNKALDSVVDSLISHKTHIEETLDNVHRYVLTHQMDKIFILDSLHRI